MEYYLSEIHQTLYFSDDIPKIRSLLKQGKIAIPILTAQNKTQDLSDFLYLVTDPHQLSPTSILHMAQRLQHIPWTIYQDSRLTLREFTPHDQKDLSAVFSDPLISSEFDLKLDDCPSLEEWITNYQKNVYSFFEFGLWGIEVDHHLVGIAGISPKEYSLGYGILPGYRSMGIVSKLCKEILLYVESELDLPYLTANVKASNLISIHILQHLGFTLISRQDVLLSYRFSF